ncbi:MAG: hypothetical protein SOW61_00135 [Erysipelotrichaceae bacterium]|nr:hypothetical protein [Erysipelotrichaceae bacterium]
MNRLWIKTITILMVTILLSGLTGCQSDDTSKKDTVKEKTPLREYTPYVQPEYDMPVILLIEDDYRQAFMCASMKAFKGGATYNGIPAMAMSSSRMEQEMQENGHATTIEGYRIVAKTDEYLLEASKALGTDEDYISGIWIQFFGMDKDDFDWTVVDKLNEEASLGISKEIFGKSPYDMFDILGINDDMLNWLINKEDMSTYWYDDDKQFWYISYSESMTTTNGGENRYKFTLSMTRSGLDVEENIFIAFDPNYVMTINYKTNYLTEDQLARRDADYNEWLASQNK